MTTPTQPVARQFAHLQRSLPILRSVCWTTTIVVAFVDTWAHRFWLNPDTTNYLDIAQAYLRGDWSNAVNALWSPFFSWLLALGIAILRPSVYWESTFVHSLNFIGLLGALLTFEYFLRGLFPEALPENASDIGPLSRHSFWILGYALFLSNALFILDPSTSAPDVWVCAIIYAIYGLLVRIRESPSSLLLFAVLGVALAFAYFTKSFYFPLSFVFLLTAWLAAGHRRRSAKPALVALVVFAVLATPWIALLSSSKGRLTSGDAGTMNLAIYIDRLPQPIFWQGQNGTGTPRHPPRLLHANPRIFDFSSHPHGTYPPGYDWSYWMDGVRVRLYPRGLLLALRQSAGTYFQLFLTQIEFGFVLVVLLCVLSSRREFLAQFGRYAYLWIPASVACAAYAIAHVEPRYVAPFLPILWITSLCCLFRATSDLSQRAARALVLAATFVTGIKAARLLESDLKLTFSDQPHEQSQIAQALPSVGLSPGSRVSLLAPVPGVYWAHLAGLTIVSEIPDGDQTAYWDKDDNTKGDLFRIFASTGAKMLVTYDPPQRASGEGWIRLGSTLVYVHPLPVPHSSQELPVR